MNDDLQELEWNIQDYKNDVDCDIRLATILDCVLNCIRNTREN